MITFIIFAALLLEEPAAPTMPNIEEQADLRCAAVAALATRSDSEDSQGAASVAMFYIGRLLGRDPNRNWKSLVENKASSLKLGPTELGMEILICREEVVDQTPFGDAEADAENERGPVPTSPIGIEEQADLRCAAIGAELGRKKPADGETAASISMFYIGRLLSREPSRNWKSLVEKEANSIRLPETELATEALTCIAVIIDHMPFNDTGTQKAAGEE